jgi:hypothetical protein
MRTKSLLMSRNTVKERILRMSQDVTQLLRTDLASAAMFSVCLDESTEVTSQARLAILPGSPAATF